MCRGRLRLWVNVGSGMDLAPAPWVNMDIWPGTGAELIADCTQPWPFDTGTLERVYMGQVVEHLDYPSGVSAAVAEAGRCLAVGGMLCVVTPDFDCFEGKRVPAEARAVMTSGGHRWPGDEHRWQPTRHVVLAAVRATFEAAHLINVLNLGDGWPAGGRGPYDCCVVATQRQH